MKHFFTKSVLSVIIFSAIFMSCEKEEEVVITAPAVTTSETVAEISHKSARITGEITDNGGADISAKGIVWGN
jgi:hypothetical protein